MHIRAHPDPRQERFFIDLLVECIQEGSLSEAFVRAEIRARRFRQDGMELIAGAGGARDRVRRAALLEEFGLAGTAASHRAGFAEWLR